MEVIPEVHRCSRNKIADIFFRFKIFLLFIARCGQKNHSKLGVVADKIDRGSDVRGMGQVIKP